MVNKGALRIAQRQLDHLKARAESGDLSLHAAHEELQAHEKVQLRSLPLARSRARALSISISEELEEHEKVELRPLSFSLSV
jgi:hypothetical protein